MNTKTLSLGVSLVLASCGTKSHNSTPSDTTPDSAEMQLPTESALQKKLGGMTASKALPPSDSQKRFGGLVDTHYSRAGTRRLYVHLDKPLYQPGESMWFRVWELASPTLIAADQDHGVMAQLISPKGATVLEKRIRVESGVAANDFELPASVQGGEYTLRMTSDSGDVTERKFIVSQYQPPQIKKKAEFLRKAYGAGDKVAAAVSLHRGTGEALANKEVTAIVQVDSVEHARFPVTTDAAGNVVVRFELPAQIRVGDGLLTILVSDGGITESLQKRIPILVKNVAFEMFPEGGDLISGLPSRIYFSAKNSLDKAADVEGKIVDENGKTLTRFSSFHNGMGRFEFTANKDETYFAVITKPSGIDAKFPLPTAKAEGCSLQAIDDYSGSQDNIRVGVWCDTNRTVIASAMLREKRLGDTAIALKAGQPSVISIPVPAGEQGAIRFTLFDEDLGPLAERLIYKGRGQDLKVSITADRKSYSPRDPVELTVKAVDLSGKAVEADLSLAIVDDTVLSFADDKTAHMLTRLYLESEMPGQEIEEPNYYFSQEAKAAVALDMVLGTQGWRRFEWQNVFSPPQQQPQPTHAPVVDMAFAAAMDDEGAVAPQARPKPAPAKPMRAQKPAAPPPPPAPEPVEVLAEIEEMEMDMQAPLGRLRANKKKRDVADGDWARAEKAAVAPVTWAAVRVFPKPNYKGRYDGPRTDFRETIHWEPSVKTDKNGEAKVSFYLSDSVTSFRITTEGVSRGGLPGRADTTLVQSKLPISLAVTMPLEVSKGDVIELPVTLANETDRSYDVVIDSEFGPAFTVVGGIPAKVAMKAGARQSFFAKLKVVGDGKNSDDGLMRVAMNTSNLKDEVKTKVRVVPLGFPQEVSLAGVVKSSATHEVVLSGALPGSIEASVTMYPSPLATMVKGTEGMIREPYGCFEQASSANYPNIMVLSYLEENQAADPALVARTMGVLDNGYQKLVGYESPKKGFEWFGGDPGHEALTAYGLLEFVDMTAVYGDVDQGMIKRTQSWLRSRRDGKGGYKRNSRALDSFGSANDEVTNGYITYALSESGDKDLGKELDYQRKITSTSKDPYVLALAVNTLTNLEPDAATTKSAAAKLAALQSKEGHYPGSAQSITMSGGQALEIETTALATLALLKQGQTFAANTRLATEWLNKSRSGSGNFSSTQATVLALKSLAAYTRASRVTQASGVATILVNGSSAGTIKFEKGQRDALVFDDIAAALKPGKNTIEVRLASKAELPYSIAITYRSKMPASSPETAVAVQTTLTKGTAPMGEGVRMNVEVKNLTDKGQPMTLARIGLPGGLAFQTWQLKELVDKKVIDFYETREREVVLYFRSLPPGARKPVELDLIARVPGNYVAPASSVYLYYTDEYKHWSEPLRMTVTR